jgi:hypothetical protein
MKRVITSIILCYFFTTCKPKVKLENLSYQNLIILSEMSSRVNNERFPNKDLGKIRDIIKYFDRECVKPGIKISDRSSIIFSTFSNNNLISIDIDKYPPGQDRQAFVNSTGNYEKSGLKEKLVLFEDSIKSIYAKERNPGLDLISLLIEKINNGNIIKKNDTISVLNQTTYVNFNNTIYLFTDGYLEYSKNNNQNFYFGEKQIQTIRSYCFLNNKNIKEALESNPKLGLPSYRNPLNNSIHLHILETHERDKDVSTLGYKNSPGLRDNEILEAVWRKWAKESNFKSFSWEKY